MAARKRKSQSETSTEVLQSALHKVEESLTVLWNDLPSWQQDNHYIHSGYRPANNSFHRSYASLYYLHNETVNIYSHLIGASLIGFSGILLYNAAAPRYGSATRGDVITIGIFFLSAVICLGMSATYHTIKDHSIQVNRFGNKLDYLGIVVLITGSGIPSIYYGLNCHSHVRILYWFMSCILGVICAMVSTVDRFRTPAWRPYRAAMFVAEGLSNVLPVLHVMRFYSFKELQDRIGLTWVLFEGICYTLGAGLYAARWPERTSPGHFDIWGNSHQLFHFLVVMAAASHAYALVKSFDYHHSSQAYMC